MKKAEVINRLLRMVFGHLHVYNCSLVRRILWNTRAKGICHQWGGSSDDYGVLRHCVSSIPDLGRILDIGCGNGRLFPLYDSLGIKEVVAQDIARNALALAQGRHDYPNITLVDLPIESLDFPPSYFDLVISNRVLQHIVPGAIASTIAATCRLGRFVYVNELSATDGIPEEPWMFRHDYVRLFGQCGFSIEKQGLLDRQTWLLFARRVAGGQVPLHAMP